MPLQPRFRAAGPARPFVDREGAIEVFEQELGRAGQGPSVLNIIGVGGIGKSRLLGELTGEIHAAADRARARIHPLRSSAELNDCIERWMTALAGELE